MLLMTKFDVFREKITDTDLICCFHDYSGGCVYQTAVQFVTQKFLNVRKKSRSRRSDSGSGVGGSSGLSLPLASMSSNHLLLDHHHHHHHHHSYDYDDGSDGGANDIFPIYTSSTDDVDDLVTNIGGALKNILYLQKMEKQRQAAAMERKRLEQMAQKRRSFGLPRRSSMSGPLQNLARQEDVFKHVSNVSSADTLLHSPRVTVLAVLGPRHPARSLNDCPF